VFAAARGVRGGGADGASHVAPRAGVIAAARRSGASAASAAAVDAPPEETGFDSLQLPEDLVARLEELRLTSPTPIQKKAIPRVLQGRSSALQSHTGSGKTLAYLLPVLARCMEAQREGGRKAGVQAMVVAPSQELAMQIVREAERLLGMDGKTAVQQLIGGANINRQMDALRRNRPVLVVGTPGRLSELSRLGALQTHSTRTLVLDEADQLLETCYWRDMVRIREHTGRKLADGERQTVVVSATLTEDNIGRYAAWAKDIELVAAGARGGSSSSSSSSSGDEGGDETGAEAQIAELAQSLSPDLSHHSVRVANPRHKVDTLRRCIHASGSDRALVFLNFGRRLRDTADKLAARNLEVGVLNGDMNKQERGRVLGHFRRGTFRVLVTSQVAARGLDVPECDAVFNFEVPSGASDYVHRAGRTGRIGNAGVVLTLAEDKEAFVLNKFSKQLGVDITPVDAVDGALVPAARGGKGRPSRGPSRDWQSLNASNTLPQRRRSRSNSGSSRSKSAPPLQRQRRTRGAAGAGAGAEREGGDYDDSGDENDGGRSRPSRKWGWRAS